MDALPVEVILNIFSFLEPLHLASLQSTSRRFLKIGRDNGLWKQLCFEYTRSELSRRRTQLQESEGSHALQIVRAMEAIARQESGNDVEAEMRNDQPPAQRRVSMMARWDPSYPDEKSNLYQEFIHRHAPIQVSWFQNVRHGERDDAIQHEATGMGILYDDAGCVADKLIAPMDDGSICIWDAAFARNGRTSKQQGRIVGRSPIGLLAGLDLAQNRETRRSQSKTIMTETGAVEVVSIDNKQKKGYFGVQSILNEVDLKTLQIISRTPYPFAITALSESSHPIPMTVGTNCTIHLHDPRQPISFGGSDGTSRCELIAGTPSKENFEIYSGANKGHATLSQPGALYILHVPERNLDLNGDIWIAGRFTSLLNYDRRCFPKIHGTVHSGARLSSLALLPFPYVPHDSSSLVQNPNGAAIREAKSIPGQTILAAGEYKGKGSLELYGLSSDPRRSVISTDSRTTQNQNTSYRNRYSASRSKLLSATTHGSKLVFSDGDGYLKWVERNGSTPVRKFNMNDAIQPRHQASNPHGPILSTTEQSIEEDIVQKIMPTVAAATNGQQDIPLGQDNLFVWTGDGLLGMVGFGSKPAFTIDDLDGKAQSALELEEIRRERQYDLEMRHALERQAAELRWVKGYGLDV